MTKPSTIEARAIEYALNERADAFRQFSRNGRWGTCGGCPRDRDHNAFPEFCAYTWRSDHMLDVHSLAENYEAFRRTGVERYTDMERRKNL